MRELKGGNIAESFLKNKLFYLFHFCFIRNLAPGEVERSECQLQQIMVEQWIQKEWVEQNRLQVNLTENTESNEITEGQTLLGEGSSNYSDKIKLESHTHVIRQVFYLPGN